MRLLYFDLLKQPSVRGAVCGIGWQGSPSMLPCPPCASTPSVLILAAPELSNLFNRDDKTFAVGDTIVFNDKVKDLESCALKCNLNDYCEMFAFCADAAG